MAVEVEQAHSIEDIFRRRLLLDHEYKALLEAMPELVTYLQSKFPEIDWITSTEKYRQHLELIQKLVHA